MVLLFMGLRRILFFFFSSRRRHTRLTCDWSSDVCSSDLGVAHRDRTRAVDRARDSRHLLRLAATVDRGARPGEIDALERRRELVEVALAALLAVGDDVDAGGLHVAHRETHGVVLRFFEVRLGDAPHLAHADAGDGARLEPRVVHQPGRLGVAADDRGEHCLTRAYAVGTAAAETAPPAVTRPGSSATKSVVNAEITAITESSVVNPAALTVGPSRYTASELTPNDTASRIPDTRERMRSSTYCTIIASTNGIAPKTKTMNASMAA